MLQHRIPAAWRNKSSIMNCNDPVWKKSHIRPFRVEFREPLASRGWLAVPKISQNGSIHQVSLLDQMIPSNWKGIHHQSQRLVRLRGLLIVIPRKEIRMRDLFSRPVLHCVVVSRQRYRPSLQHSRCWLGQGGIWLQYVLQRLVVRYETKSHRKKIFVKTLHSPDYRESLPLGLRVVPFGLA